MLMGLAAHKLLLFCGREAIMLLGHLYYVSRRYSCLQTPISFLATLLNYIRRFLFKWFILSVLARLKADVGGGLIVDLTQGCQFDFFTVHVELKLLDEHFIGNVRKNSAGIATDLSIRGFSNGHLRNHLPIGCIALLEYGQGDLQMISILVLGSFGAIG